MKKAELEQLVTELKAQLNERTETMTTKAELEKENAELKAEIEKLKSGKKEKEFNVWNNTYFQLAKAYLNSDKKTSFEITVRHFNDKHFTTEDGKKVDIDGSEKVLRYLQKNNILKIAGLTPDIVEGKTVYKVLIKEFNANGKLNGKKGEYNPFEYAITKLTA